MIAVIFEVQTTEDGNPTYLALAQALRPELDKIKGIHIDRTLREPEHAGQDRFAVLLA